MELDGHNGAHDAAHNVANNAAELFNCPTGEGYDVELFAILVKDDF